MWSWLPDELLQRIVQLVVERAPRALAIFALLDQRSRVLAAARLERIKPLLTAPFHLTVQIIFCGSGALNLSNHGLHSGHMEVLSAALVSLGLPQLMELHLYRNQIGDAGISALVDALSRGALPQLEKLWLGGNSIGDVGLSALADVVSRGALPALEKLFLDSNQIGDAGMSAFASACASGALDHLTVCWRPPALSSCLETPHVHSPDSEHLFDVPYTGA